MTYRLIIRLQAEAEIAAIAVWYQTKQAGLGHRFLRDVDAAIQNLLLNPMQFPCIRRKPQVRRVILKHFPHRMFFVLEEDAIIIFCVLHAARHDREWKGKLS